MATITTATVSRVSPIVDRQSVVRSSGRQVDWANVSATNADGKKYIPAFTAVGTLLGSGKISPRVVTTNPAVGITETDIVQGDKQDALSGHGMIVGARLYENLLPDATGGPPKTLAAAIITELRANGHAWSFETYADTRS
jgi:hypothetical protein